ncbi:MAG TPA: DUF922 domain-containing protein [Dehalococcoidia bacterium]|nr:DUF922 domain-containing protein [Dehalococcoidia bacterium]
MGSRFLLAVILAVLLASCRLEHEPPRPASGLSAPREEVVLEDRSSIERVRLNERVTRRQYLVAGDTEAAIRASLDAHGPGSRPPSASGGAGRFDGLTEWSLAWSFRFERGAGFCLLAAADVFLDVTVIVPLHESPDALPPALGQKWQSFIATLETHEFGHVARQRAVARELAAAFNGLPPAPTCQELSQQLSATADEYLVRIRLIDAAYDTETGHGLTEGAIFP